MHGCERSGWLVVSLMLPALLALSVTCAVRGPLLPEALSDASTAATDATYYIYFVVLPNNTKHDPSYYGSSLNATCGRLAAARKRFSIRGDVDWVLDHAPSCAGYEPSRASRFASTTLPEPRAYATPIGAIANDCLVDKFSGPPDAFPEFVMKPSLPGELRSQNRVWLSKLGVLCDAARAHPDELSVLVDAGLGHVPDDSLAACGGKTLHAQHWLDADRTHEATHENGKLQIETYPEEWHRFFLEVQCLWTSGNECRERAGYYGTRACQTSPKACGQAMAIKGRDCSTVQDAFTHALQAVAANTTCHCFDEEMVFTHMFTTAPQLLQPIVGEDVPPCTIADAVLGKIGGTPAG